MQMEDATRPQRQGDFGENRLQPLDMVHGLMREHDIHRIRRQISDL